MKKRVAIWMFGGIGTGNFSQGQPLLENLTRKLSADFEIIVYSRSLINSDYVPQGFQLKTAPLSAKNQTQRWLLLLIYFVRDHFKKRFSLVCAFWGFPGGFIATLAAKVLFLPIMVNMQGGDSTGIPSLNYGVMHRRGFRSMTLWTYRHATLLSALTNFQKQMVAGYGVSRTIRVIPFGVDASLFKSTEKKRKQKEPHHFIHVSNFNSIKDPDTLLKTFAMICQKLDATLRIVGDEYYKGNARRLCAELGIEQKVDFYGPVIYSHMPLQYAWADTMLHTSLFEGQGIVIAEAAMAGVLIAGTDVGLISDLGERGTVVVPPGEFRLLAEKVLETLSNFDLIEEKKKYALEWALQHDFSWTVEQYKKIFNEIG